MSMRKFFEVVGLPKPKNYRDLLKAYSMEKIYLYDAQQVSIVTSKSGEGNSGARFFKYRYMEPFQFWNKDVSFKHIKLNNGSPYVEIQTKSGETHKIETKSLNADQILEKVLAASQGKKINVNIPE
ncbi:hypothetical protein CYY_010508 [Polysphondylium violaceum]|uniref:Ribosomal protein/NADH dehydrogenase domain-containing protein n=1 Tax=Polysphondylium violaceum TaxID=133409 RepID=A0A8J4PL68_9MYCE|nr:hypothetical protein CYY_010508 [Polysphondylium violaceum]